MRHFSARKLIHTTPKQSSARHSIIVGYATNPVNAGYGVKTISFLKVGSEKIDLTSVTPVSATYEGEGLEGCAQLMLLNAGGGTITDAIYMWENWGSPEETGWTLDSTFIKPGDFELDPGTAVWIYVDSIFTDLQFQCAGQVAEKTVTIPVVKGYSIGGNPFPVPYDMINAYPTSDTYEGEGLEGCVSMMRINAGGGTITDAIYMWENWGSPEETGWTLDSTFIGEGDLVLGIGESLWLDNSVIGDLYLNFPCMIGEDK